MSLSRREGFTLLEVMVSLVVLTVSFLSFGSLFVLNARSYDVVVQETVAMHSLRERAELIRTTPFDQIAATYSNYAFTVPDISGNGTVTIYTNETLTTAEAAKLGLPRDLNGDGLATSTNVSASYELLPMKIEVTWTNQAGQQSEALYLLYAQEVN